jgi:hypothetical protein
MGNYRTPPIGMIQSTLFATGGFGAVSVTDDLTRKRKIAVKHFAGVSDRQSFLREVAMLMKRPHPYVVRILNPAFAGDPRETESHTEFAAHGSHKPVLEKGKAGETRRFEIQPEFRF